MEERLPISEEQQMWKPANHFNLKCTMSESTVDTIVSAVYLMMKGSSRNAGLDFAEVVRQFLCDLTVPEQRQFWAEIKALHPQMWQTDLTTINSPEIATLTEQHEGIATGSVQ
jgi:hypothetical protein